MKNAAILLSLLHEGAADNTATRLFRGVPVLAHTLSRVALLRPLMPELAIVGTQGPAASSLREPSHAVRPVLVACWDDQLADVVAAAGDAEVFTVGPRKPIPSLDAVSAAQRWADGWRSGPLQTCFFDRGFHGQTALEALNRASALEANETSCDALVLVDPAAALLDPELLEGLLDHAADHPDRDLIFHPVAPGLSGTLLRRGLIEQLARTNQHPGRALHYVPDHYAHDPLATLAAAPHPVATARTLARFTLDHGADVRRFERLAAPAGTGGEALVNLVHADQSPGEFPRDLRLEVTTRRATRAIFRPQVGRDELPVNAWLPLLDALVPAKTRLTLAGNGDPLLYPEFPRLAREITQRGIPLAIETDLVAVSPEAIQAAAGGADLLLFHLPATTRATYAALMGVDAIEKVIVNLRTFLAARSGPTPIAIPVFTKCRQNLPEMEPWYDHWLRTLGTAIVEGATTHAGRIADHAPSDMSPQGRIPCRRLQNRMQILSNGTVATCEYDTVGIPHRPSHIGNLASLWAEALAPVRRQHAGLSLNVLCSNCREWHRP